MSKRVDLLRDLGSEFMQGAVVQLEDEKAAEIIKRGKGRLAAEQTVYNHMDEMPVELQEESARMLSIADAAGGYREQGARARATALEKSAAKSASKKAE